MKKRTNKILIIAIVVFILAFTIKFFINANNIKMEKPEKMEEQEPNELIINNK